MPLSIVHKSSASQEYKVHKEYVMAKESILYFNPIYHQKEQSSTP